MHPTKLLSATVLSAVACTAGVAGLSASSSDAATAKKPVALTLFSPGSGDRAGATGVGFVVDLALDATSRAGNTALSAANGYRPSFGDPADTATFKPGPNSGAPGLVVMLSSTPTLAGTPFQGARTNLAGLFQINGVATIKGRRETWNTWFPGKPLFGTGKRVTLTAYVVKGTAPAVVPARGPAPISNVERVSFTIAG